MEKVPQDKFLLLAGEILKSLEVKPDKTNAKGSKGVCPKLEFKLRRLKTAP
jgi:hypothetical protein